MLCCGIAGLLAACGPSASSLAAKAFQSDVAKAKAALSDKLPDPESTEFRNLKRVSQRAQAGSTTTAICGEINAKNRVGGYDGYRRFFYVLALKAAPFDHKGIITGPAFKQGDWEIIADDLSSPAAFQEASMRDQSDWIEKAADFVDFCKEDGKVRADADLVDKSSSAAGVLIVFLYGRTPVPPQLWDAVR